MNIAPLSLPIKDRSSIFRKKPLTAIILFTSGLGEFVEAEIQSILNDPWIPEKKSTEQVIIHRYKEKIILRKISLQSLLGIGVRSYFIKDIYIQIKEISSIPNDFSVTQFLPDIQKHLPMSNSPSLKIQIRKNKNLTEESIDREWHSLFPIAEEQGNSNERYLLDIYEKHASFYKSLRDRPIYQRGYRVPFSHSAPVTEDIACILLKHVLDIINKSIPNPRIKAFVPFSGTGTLGLELYSLFNHISPNICKTIEESSIEFFHGADWFTYLNKKSIEIIQKNAINISCYDNYLPVVENAKNNLANFMQCVQVSTRNLPISIELGDFWDKELIANPEESDLVLLALNPPYGIRFQNRESNSEFYNKIAHRIAKYAVKQGNLPFYGFLLCPDESSYFAALRVWTKIFHLETLHFSQGSLSLRALFFSPNQ